MSARTSCRASWSACSTAIRHLRSDEPARGYYEDAYDLTALAEQVLVPLGTGRLTVRSALCDFPADEPRHTTERVGRDAVVVFECTFIQREELRGLWDLVLHLEVSPDIALERVARRDAAASGGEAAAIRAHARRYSPAWGLYEAEQDPRRSRRRRDRPGRPAASLRPSW
ncbi:hypothetical protein ACHAAC_04595 [Aeromicrobium sp. CF4.19]|uniref:hypothetical protein n=1 Tax=Aeromicrobium sp. CF4.19 TaxID=3373082 RepID=UPI003EE4DC7A